MSIVWNMWFGRFANPNPVVAWRNANIIHKRYAHAFSKGGNDNFIKSSDTKDNLKSKNANAVENGPIDLLKRSHANSFEGETQMLSTIAAKGEKPKPPKPSPGSGPQHDEERK